MKEIIRWGIIGAGDVAELKSGPAFQKLEHSELLAVMRRNPEKAADFARRHGVPSWYSDADKLLARDDIDAVYIATPPSSHRELALKALRAGKDVYLEKPVSRRAAEAREILPVLEESGRKLTVAHYRRALPSYRKVDELLRQKHIGHIRFVQMRIFRSPDASDMTRTEDQWRLKPEVSGGGLFYDIAPHQIDLMLHFFGAPLEVDGRSMNRSGGDGVDDFVSARILFPGNIPFEGLWYFNADHQSRNLDRCEIYGSEGMISFSLFGSDVEVSRKGRDEHLVFDNPPHVQQPMIASAVDYFLGKGPNLCSLEEGIEVMAILDGISGAEDFKPR